MAVHFSAPGHLLAVTNRVKVRGLPIDIRTDQWVIDEFAGHSTEEQRRRYRHIFPDVKARVIADVFG